MEKNEKRKKKTPKDRGGGMKKNISMAPPFISK